MGHEVLAAFPTKRAGMPIVTQVKKKAGSDGEVLGEYWDVCGQRLGVIARCEGGWVCKSAGGTGGWTLGQIGGGYVGGRTDGLVQRGMGR